MVSALQTSLSREFYRDVALSIQNLNITVFRHSFLIGPEHFVQYPL